MIHGFHNRVFVKEKLSVQCDFWLEWHFQESSIYRASAAVFHCPFKLNLLIGIDVTDATSVLCKEFVYSPCSGHHAVKPTIICCAYKSSFVSFVVLHRAWFCAIVIRDDIWWDPRLILVVIKREEGFIVRWMGSGSGLAESNGRLRLHELFLRDSKRDSTTPVVVKREATKRMTAGLTLLKHSCCWLFIFAGRVKCARQRRFIRAKRGLAKADSK